MCLASDFADMTGKRGFAHTHKFLKYTYLYGFNTYILDEFYNLNLLIRQPISFYFFNLI